MLCCAGDPSYDLCPAGVDVLVDSSNLVPYIQAVVDATLGAGIEAQMTAFREGFNEVSAVGNSVVRTAVRVGWAAGVWVVITS